MEEVPHARKIEQPLEQCQLAIHGCFLDDSNAVTLILLHSQGTDFRKRALPEKSLKVVEHLNVPIPGAFVCHRVLDVLGGKLVQGYRARCMKLVPCDIGLS